jgi:hypothetical protein
MLQKTSLTRFPSARANRAVLRRAAGRSILRHLLRALGLVLVLVVVCIGAVTVMLLSGPVELSFIRGQVVRAIASGIGPDYRTEVGRVFIAIDPVLGLVLEIDDLHVRDQRGDEVASLPTTRIALDVTAPLGARSLIRSVDVSGAAFSFVRGSSQFYLGTPSTPPPAAEPETAAAGAGAPLADARGFPELRAGFQLLDGGLDRPIRAAAGAGFRRFTLVDGTIDVWDAELKEQRSFSRTDVSVEIDAAGNEMNASIAAGGYSGRWTVSAERSVDPHSGERVLTANFSQLTLADLVPALARPEGFHSDIPLCGRASARLSAEGEVEEAAIRLDLGAGNLFFGNNKDSVLLDEGSLRLHWDVPRDRLVVDPSAFYFGEGRGIITGSVAPAGERSYRFNLETRGAVLAPRDSDAPAMVVDRIAAVGTVDYGRRLVTFDNAVLSARGASLTASGSIGFEGPTPSLAMAATSTTMSADALKQIWPPMIAGDARRWVLQNVISGRISAARFEAAVPGGYLWDPARRPLPEDAMKLDVRLDGVSFRPFGDLPPVTDASGNFAIAGSTLGVDIEKGTVTTASGEKVAIDAGAFAIPNTAERHPDAHVVLDLSGSARGLAEVADQRPFQALSRNGIDPAGVSGTATATVSAAWPLRPDVTDGDVDWHVAVKATGLGSAAPIEGRTIRDGALTITASPEEIQIRGKAEVDGGMVDLDMVQPMHDADGGDDERRLRVTLDEKARQRLGIGLDEVIGGTVGATLSGLPDGGQHYDIDLTRARLTLTSLGWSKGIGVAADLAFDLLPGDGGGYRVQNIKVTGDGFGFTGSAVLDASYGVISADIQDFSLRKGDSIDFSLKRTETGYTISARASEFDARGLIAHLRDAAENPASAPDISIDARIDRLIGFNQEAVDNASVLVESHAGAIQDLEFAGAIAGTPISASYTEQGGGAVLDMTVGDAGRFLRLADMYGHIWGGALRIVGRRTARDGPLAGTFDVADFHVVDEPAMERLMSESTSATDRTGSDPDNVAFDRMALNFTLRGSTIVVDDALLRGTEMGATFSGWLDFANDRVNLTGTYLPAYRINNMFGRLPIIGLALGGGSREGLLGVTFKIDGVLSAPRLQVNALSAIAPGIFRKIFEFQ